MRIEAVLIDAQPSSIAVATARTMGAPGRLSFQDEEGSKFLMSDGCKVN